MKFDLASHIRRPSRRPIALAKITTTKAQADALAAIYLRTVAEWSKRAEAITAAYGRALAKLQMDSADDAGSTIDGIASEIQRLVLLLTPDLRDWALRVESTHRGKWVSNVLSTTSVDLSTVLSSADVPETVDATVNWNVSLIRDVSEETRRRIANNCVHGLAAAQGGGRCGARNQRGDRHGARAVETHRRRSNNQTRSAAQSGARSGAPKQSGKEQEIDL